MDEIQKTLLQEVAGIHEVPTGAYSLRINGQLVGKNSSENIEIVKKDDLPGIDIYIKPGTKKESVHIPVIIAQTGIKELVYNDFHVGADCDVTIVAGCGIHNGGRPADKGKGDQRRGLRGSEPARPCLPAAWTDRQCHCGVPGDYQYLPGNRPGHKGGKFHRTAGRHAPGSAGYFRR